MINKTKIDFIKPLKSFLRFSLCLVILSSSFHLYEHNHSKENGYSICKPECEETSHHSLNYDCEKCLTNRHQKKAINYSDFNNHIKNKPVPNFIDIFIFNKYIVYSFSFSRPPPVKIT